MGRVGASFRLGSLMRDQVLSLTTAARLSIQYNLNEEKTCGKSD